MIDFAVMAIRKGLAGRPTQAWLQAPWYGWLVISTMRLWKHGADAPEAGTSAPLTPAALTAWVAGFVRSPDSVDGPSPGAMIPGDNAALPEGRLWRWCPSLPVIGELACLLFEVPDGGAISFDEDTLEVATALAAIDFHSPDAQAYWAGIVADVTPGAEAPHALIHRHQVWLRALLHGPLPADKTAIRAMVPHLYAGDELAALLA